MRLSDAMKPAMDWSEAAMLPARPRTVSAGAALRQLKQVNGLDVAANTEKGVPVPAEAGRDARRLMLKRAAYSHAKRLIQRANSCTT